MSAISIAQTTIGTANPVSKDFLGALKEKYDFLPEVKDMMNDEDLAPYFVKKSRKKVSPIAEERQGAYHSGKCDARVWKEKPRSGGLGYDNIQCSSKKVDGFGCLCKKHFKQQQEGKLWLGLVTEGRPKNPIHPTAGPKMWSTDEDGNEVVKEKKQRKKSSEKKEKKTKTKKAKKKSDQEVKEAMSVAELQALLAKAEEREKVDDGEETDEMDTESESEKKESEKEEEKEDEKEPDPEEEKEPEKEKKEPEDEEDEEDIFEMITVDGVEYQHNKEDNVVIRLDDFAQVGKWNKETEEIDFDEEDDE